MSLIICVCSFNRATSLAKTLDSIAQCQNELQSGDGLIVVDNNSTDETCAVVKAFSKRLPIQYLFEPKQGLSAARNRALTEYSSDSLIFFDDDVTVLPGAITAYRQGFKDHPQAGFFGGQIGVDWQGSRPDWLQSDDLVLLNGLMGHYAPDPGKAAVSWPSDKPLPFGANFALRRTTVERVGEFDRSLGVSGTSLGRGEETDYFERALDNDIGGVYLENAKVSHRFQTERFTLAHLIRYGMAKGAVLGVASDSKLHRAGLIGAFALRGLWQLASGRRDRFYQCVINIGIQLGRRG